MHFFTCHHKHLIDTNTRERQRERVNVPTCLSFSRKRLYSHSRVGGNPDVNSTNHGIPAYAGMTGESGNDRTTYFCQWSVLAVGIFVVLIYAVWLMPTSPAFAAYDGNSAGYGWGSQSGWVSFNTTSNYGAQITRTYLDGYTWGEDIGYVSLKRDSGSPDYSVAATQSGTDIRLSGLAWGPQSGWVKLAADGSDYGNTAADNYGVKIDITTGEFSGYAWGEDVGWISFNGNCTTGTTGTCAGGVYQVTTDYYPLANGEACNNGNECANSLCIAGTCRAAAACSSYTGSGCSEDGNDWDSASGGACLSNGTCDTSDPVTMDCGSAGNATCEVNTDATYSSCSARGGDACDTTAGNGNFSQNGMCFDDGGGTAGVNFSCQTNGHICYDGSHYQTSCASCSAGNGCDSTVTSGDFSADGICLTDNSCDNTTVVACDCSYAESCAGASYYSGCSSVNNNDRCDTNISDGVFNDAGICADGACVSLSAETLVAGSCADYLDNDGDGKIDLYDDSCNSAPNAPLLVTPSDASTTDDNTPTLSASYSDSAQAGYTDYRIVFTNQSDCVNGNNVVISGRSSKTITSSANTIWTPPLALASSGMYYWCARNFDGYLYSAWTEMGSFVLSAAGASANTDVLLQGGLDMQGIEWR